MNENDLVNADLHDDETNGLEEVAVETVPDIAAAVSAAPTPSAVVQAKEDAVVKVKGKAGRKVDTTGKTALGMARILYASNPNLGTKELKELFVKELGPVFGTKPEVAQTYVSYVRKKKA